MQHEKIYMLKTQTEEGVSRMQNTMSLFPERHKIANGKKKAKGKRQ
jgi:hypothetical protein